MSAPTVEDLTQADIEGMVALGIEALEVLKKAPTAIHACSALSVTIGKLAEMLEVDHVEFCERITEIARVSRQRIANMQKAGTS